jgi:hypothetical protein
MILGPWDFRPESLPRTGLLMEEFSHGCLSIVTVTLTYPLV